MRAAALLLLAALAAAPVRADPLDRERARLAKEGFSLSQRADAEVPEGTLSALLFARKDGEGWRLLVYLVHAGKPKMLHFEPSLAGLRLSALHGGGGLPDLYGDGSRVIAYSVSFSGLRQDALTLLRYARGRITRVGRPLPFAEFEDVDLDGRFELVEREHPLGTLFSLGCDDFSTMARSAERTRVLAFDKGGNRDVSSRYPAFYRAHMGALEEKLSSLDPAKTGRHGEYLETAVSLYYDYETLGRRREGFERLRGAFKPPAGSPPVVKRCLKEMGAELRRKLNIPADWD